MTLAFDSLLHQKFTTNAVTTWQVINALILREMNAQFGNSRLGYLWAIFKPLLSILVLYFVFGLISRDSSGIPLLLFIVTGWFTFGYYEAMVSRIGAGEGANRSLLMHNRVTRLDVITARGVLETLTTISFFTVGATLSILFEGSSLPADLQLVVVSFFAAGMIGTGVGLVIAGLSTHFPMAMNFISPINRVGFFVSGVLFTATMLPSWTYEYLRWNPLLHPIEGIRQGWFDAYESPILDLRYSMMFAVPLIILGLYLERRTRRGIKFG